MANEKTNKKTSDKEILKSLMITEAKKLKKVAKKSELKNLDFNGLNPESKYNCIYGQMTGDCFSNRAGNLILKCATRIYVVNQNAKYILKGAKLNGPPEKRREDTLYKEAEYFSPIEKFIYNKENRNNGNNATLIAFLKGETKTLKLK